MEVTRRECSIEGGILVGLEGSQGGRGEMEAMGVDIDNWTKGISSGEDVRFSGVWKG